MASIVRDDLSTLPGDDPSTTMRSKFGSECQCTSVTDRRTDADIVAQVRDVYITFRAKNDDFRNGGREFQLIGPESARTKSNSSCAWKIQIAVSFDDELQWLTAAHRVTSDMMEPDDDVGIYRPTGRVYR